MLDGWVGRVIVNIVDPTLGDRKGVYVAGPISKLVIAVREYRHNAYPASPNGSVVVKTVGGNTHVVESNRIREYPFVVYRPVDIHISVITSGGRLTDRGRPRVSSAVFHSVFGGLLDVPIDVSVRDSYAWVGGHCDWDLGVKLKV